VRGGEILNGGVERGKAGELEKWFWGCGEVGLLGCEGMVSVGTKVSEWAEKAEEWPRRPMNDSGSVKESEEWKSGEGLAVTVGWPEKSAWAEVKDPKEICFSSGFWNGNVVSSKRTWREI
jgi:hypothetical protein